MKKVNEAYERLRGVMPDLSLILQDEKDTKVGFSNNTISKYIQMVVAHAKKTANVFNWWYSVKKPFR